MNSNAIHNVLNIASVVLAMLTAGLLATGCTATPAGGFDCAASWIKPEYTSIGIAVLQALKLGINFFRDGFGGMWKPQPPVDK